MLFEQNIITAPWYTSNIPQSSSSSSNPKFFIVFLPFHSILAEFKTTDLHGLLSLLVFVNLGKKPCNKKTYTFVPYLSLCLVKTIYTIIHPQLPIPFPVARPVSLTFLDRHRRRASLSTKWRSCSNSSGASTGTRIGGFGNQNWCRSLKSCTMSDLGGKVATKKTH